MAGTKLPDKILSLAEGEWMILPDEKSSMDRALVTLRKRSPRLAHVEFKAERIRYLDDYVLRPGIRITVIRRTVPDSDSLAKAAKLVGVSVEDLSALIRTETGEVAR